MIINLPELKHDFYKLSKGAIFDDRSLIEIQCTKCNHRMLLLNKEFESGVLDTDDQITSDGTRLVSTNMSVFKTCPEAMLDNIS